MTILDTSDLHFHHPYVAKLRGFTTTDDEGNICGDPVAHDEMIIENWNKAVRKDDIVYLAGDVAMNWKGVEEKIARLNGKIILICGNHDIMSAIHRNGWMHREKWTGEGKFAAILDFARRKVGKREFLISHYPYWGDSQERDRLTQFRLRDEGLWLLHGHTHSPEKRTPQHFDSCFFCGDLEPGASTCACGNADIWVTKQIHIGLDAWDLAPVREQVVLELMKSAEADRPERPQSVLY